VSSVQVSGLTKGFGGQPVLRGVDLVVPAASTTAVLGPSGCGKTTLLRLVAGFLAPDAGTIRLDGVLVADGAMSRPASKRRVGYVPQEGALFPHLDVAANIAFGLPRAQRRSRGRVVELLELLGLDPVLASRFPHELSGGQQQRVAVARALAPSPDVVLLDEPFSSLDSGLREDTGTAVLQALRATGATAVLVTHDQDEALSLADQVAVMREGRLAQVGSPREVYQQPVDRSVAEFVGAAVVLDAVVEADLARCALGALPVAAGTAPGPASVLVRPEQLVLGAVGSGVRAQVVDVGYHGHDATVRLRLPDLVAPVLARVHGGSAPSVGDAVGVTVLGVATVL
jgi:iron(III) transport system ATP-binding protein